MLRYLTLYKAFFTMRMKILLEYRIDFIIGSLSSIVLQAANFLVLILVLQHIRSLDGWDLTELQLLFGSTLLSLSLNQMFADNLWTMTFLVRTGKLDSYLTRPINPLFHLLSERFNHVGIGDFLSGLILALSAWHKLEITFASIHFFYWVITVIGGGLIFVSLNLLCSLAAFWLLDSVTITRVVFDNHIFARYPLTIFPPILTALLTWLIPYGQVSYYPVASLLGKSSVFSAVMPLLVALLLTWISIRGWHTALRHYNSSGT